MVADGPPLPRKTHAHDDRRLPHADHGSQVAAFLQLLELGRHVLVSDVDTVWTADPQARCDVATEWH